VIPRIIWQTWKTKDESTWTRPERRWVRSWRQNPGFRHELCDDDDCLAFVRAEYPEALEAYLSFRPVEKADFWRILVTHKHGGVYADFDTACRVPVTQWLRPEDEMVLGLMDDKRDEFPGWKPRRAIASGGEFDPESGWRDYPVMFTNWAFAARPGHPLFGDIIARITQNATDPYFVAEDPDWTCKKTGPGAVTDALRDYLAKLGSSTDEVATRLRTQQELRIGDLRLFDYQGFHRRYVAHYGMRSWEPRHGLDLILNRLKIALS
jgi:mannosyltransferase OCH1-like enzyme